MYVVIGFGNVVVVIGFGNVVVVLRVVVKPSLVSMEDEDKTILIYYAVNIFNHFAYPYIILKQLIKLSCIIINYVGSIITQSY